MDENVPVADELLPLKPDALTILLTLIEGDAHGYAFLQAADARTGARGHLQPGSLYRLLRQMLEAGMIERLGPGVGPAEGDDRRRYYRVTAFGREVAAAETRRMAQVLRLARRLDVLAEGELA